VGLGSLAPQYVAQELLQGEGFTDVRYVSYPSETQLGPRTISRLDRHPYLNAARSGRRVEILAVALEVRRIRDLMTGFRQPLVPDGVPGAPDRGNVVAMGEHHISVFWNPRAVPIRGNPGKVGYLDTADVVKVTRVIAVAAHAVGRPVDLSAYIEVLK
jgi:hypothetical protein